MPREHVYANLVTVHDGDLTLLAARSRADVLRLDDSCLQRALDRAAATDADDPGRLVQLRAVVAWSRGSGLVTLGVDGYRHTDRAADEPAELDLGGFHLELSWSGCNDLVRVVRRARDQSFGAPE